MSAWMAAVVPALDEVGRLERTLEPMLSEPALALVVVVDGGSVDGTRALVRRLAEAQQGRRAAGRGRGLPALELLEARRGRARQMNAGAARAMSVEGVEVLHFVHADCGLPAGWAEAIRGALRDPAVVGGAFLTWTVDDEGEGRLGPLLHLADLRSRYSRLPYGDQAPFVRAAAFAALGGFADLPLMEDLELSGRLRGLGRVVTLPGRVRVSGRRFIARPFYYTALVNVFPALYRLGVSPHTLARWYDQVR